MSSEVDYVSLVTTPIALPWHRRIAFGLGHFFNDMCASMWFTYLLVFATKVLGFSSTVAGSIVLVGQVTDAISTPLVGLESDGVGIFKRCSTYGRRKSWHLIGSVLVTFSFAFLFMKCFGCVIGVTTETVQLVYYIPLVVIFQIGWACVQISHLALIPDLSTCQHERSTLNGIRYAFTVVANLAVFALVYIFLGLDIAHRDVTEHDAPSFRYVAIIVTGIGVLFSILFHLGTKEHSIFDDVTNSGLENDDYSNPSINGQSKAMKKHWTWRQWLKDPDFYLVCVLYMCTRIFGNVTQAYLPLYVLETQHFTKKYIAIVPMVVYLSSFVISAVLSFQFISRYFGRKVVLLLGIFLGAGACVWMWFHQLHNQVYGVSVLLGVSSTILLVTTLAMIADLIGDNTESAAFVYGAMSFTDKISSGLAIQIVQILQPICVPSECVRLDYYFRGVMVIVPGAALLVSLFALFLLWPRQIGERVERSLHESPTTNSLDDPIIG